MEASATKATDGGTVPPKDPAAAAPKASKPKKRVIHKPTPPPSVTTACLILRGCVAGVTGASLSDVDVTPMQPTFIKDRAPTGKFIVNLGKKCGTVCAVDVPEDSQGQGVLLDQIEKAANGIIEEDLPVVQFELAGGREEAVKLYGGDYMFDSSSKKPKKGGGNNAAPLRVAFIRGGCLAAVSPSDPLLSSTGQVGRITLDRGNLGCSVTAGKKARKCDVALKFLVEEGKVTAAAASRAEQCTTAASLSDPVDPELVKPLLSTSVRLQEGREFMDLMKANEEKEMQEVSSGTAGLDLSQKAKEAGDEDMVVTAMEVKGKIDYNKLVKQFGSKLLEPDHLTRLHALTVGRGRVPYLHRFFRREIFFSHRDIDRILLCLERGEPLYLYTGRGPSSDSMHLGHLIPFLMTQWLQQAFGCPLVIQMTDDEKFLFKGEYSDATGDNLDNFKRLTYENARDIIACGFDKQKTFLFSDLDYVGTMYPNIVRIWKAVTTNTVNGIFGFDGQSNIGKVAFPAVQAAPSFPSSFPTVLNAGRDSNMACLIPCAIDQDPYFRMTRDVAHKLVPKSHPLGGKPALVHSKFFPPLQGATGKMSSSDPNSAVFLTDTPKDIERKIKEYAFSGGRETKKEQMELGADLEVDVSYQWLRFFLEDDEELSRIGQEYGTGSGEYWSTGKVKARLVEVLQDLVADHQRKRADITDEVVEQWMKERCIL